MEQRKEIGRSFRKSKIITKVQNQNTIEKAQSCLAKTILQAAEITILKTSETRPTVAWWNKECEREERIMIAEYRNTNETQKVELNYEHSNVEGPLNRFFRKKPGKTHGISS